MILQWYKHAYGRKGSWCLLAAPQNLLLNSVYNKVRLLAGYKGLILTGQWGIEKTVVCLYLHRQDFCNHLSILNMPKMQFAAFLTAVKTVTNMAKMQVNMHTANFVIPFFPTKTVYLWGSISFYFTSLCKLLTWKIFKRQPFWILNHQELHVKCSFCMEVKTFHIRTILQSSFITEGNRILECYS